MGRGVDLRSPCNLILEGSRKRWQPHTVLLHDLQELDNDLGGRSDQDLALAGLLGVVDALESIVENGSADHLDGVVVL